MAHSCKHENETYSGLSDDVKFVSFFCVTYAEATRFQLKILAVKICDLDWGNQVKNGH